jgi:hypothetical protein
MDAQTRVEDTAAPVALVQSLVRLHAEGTRPVADALGCLAELSAEYAPAPSSALA